MSWSKTELHCPQCGVRSVFVEDAPGDYYVGETHVCVSCESSFTLQLDPAPVTGYGARNVRAAIEAAALHSG